MTISEKDPVVVIKNRGMDYWICVTESGVEYHLQPPGAEGNDILYADVRAELIRKAASEEPPLIGPPTVEAPE